MIDRTEDLSDFIYAANEMKYTAQTVTGSHPLNLPVSEPEPVHLFLRLVSQLYCH